MACFGCASRYDVQIDEVDSGLFRETFLAPRLRSEAMRNMVLDLLGLNMMRSWEQALEEDLSVAVPATDSGKSSRAR